MNNKNINYLSLKLEELNRENIISTEQTLKAKEYFSNFKKEGTSITTIITAIGILLVALSMITIFAFNWDNLSKEIKIVLAFIPLILTAVMLFFTMKKDDTKLKLYTSIFAPIAIIASNSLISQIFHIQTEIYEILFLCLLMFLPIAIILRNRVSVTIYGLGCIQYISSTCTLNDKIIQGILISIPFIAYSICNYIKNKEDKFNIVLWLMSVIIISIPLFTTGIINGTSALLRPEVILIYIYMIYLLSLIHI